MRPLNTVMPCQNYHVQPFPVLSLNGCLRGSPRQVTIIKKKEEELNKCNSFVLSSRIKQPEGKQSHVLSSHLCYSAVVCQHWRAIFPRRLLSFPKLTAREQRRVLAITCRHGYRMPPQV